jgi:hypothetical protein
MSEEQFGTAEAYTRAFRALADEGIPDNHIALLQAHFNSPAHTTTWARLAQAVGYAKGGAVHLQYGRLGRRLAQQLGKRPDYWNLILVDWAQHKDPSGHTAYVLRRPVIEALTCLGIVTERGKSVGAPHPPSIEEAEADLSKRVTASLRLAPDQRRLRLSLAEKHPTRIEVVTSVFVRNADVVAEVLHRANGWCESCGSLAPFMRASDGSPYLEIHHRVRLADGREDTVENALALCPNCHRKAHYG